MKKMSVFFVLFSTLCKALPLGAQIHLGVLGGLNLANLSVNPAAGVEYLTRTGFGFGEVLDYDLGEHIALHVEPMYLQKGTDAKQEGVGFEVKLAYFEVPVMLKVTFGTSYVKPYIMAGPAIGFNLSARAEGGDGDDSEEIDIKNDITDVDFGLGFGAGLSLPMRKNAIFVEARYDFGLRNILVDSDSDVKTKGLQIFAGITIPLGGE